VYERFTEKARRLVIYSQSHARDHEDLEITPLHLLLSILANDNYVYGEPDGGIVDCTATKVMTALEIDPQMVMARVLTELDAAPRTPHETPDQMPFSDSAKEVLKGAWTESKALDHDYVGTVHILLSLLANAPEDSACKVLSELGFTHDATAATTKRFLRGDFQRNDSRKKYLEEMTAKIQPGMVVKIDFTILPELAGPSAQFVQTMAFMFMSEGNKNYTATARFDLARFCEEVLPYVSDLTIHARNMMHRKRPQIRGNFEFEVSSLVAGGAGIFVLLCSEAEKFIKGQLGEVKVDFTPIMTPEVRPDEYAIATPELIGYLTIVDGDRPGIVILIDVTAVKDSTGDFSSFSCTATVSEFAR
jgi:hypothetical protein